MNTGMNARLQINIVGDNATTNGTRVLSFEANVNGVRMEVQAGLSPTDQKVTEFRALRAQEIAERIAGGLIAPAILAMLEERFFDPPNPE